MTQRNPLNERYRSEERTGKTKKSAASAKPVSKAGASVHVRTEDPKERRRREKAKRREMEEQAASVPVTYTAKEAKWRRVWWGLMIGALVALMISWFAARISETYALQITYGAMIAAYACLGFMIFVDIKFVRPARVRAREKGMRGLTKKEQREMAARRAAEEEYRRTHPSGFAKFRQRMSGKKEKDDTTDGNDIDAAISAATTEVKATDEQKKG